MTSHPLASAIRETRRIVQCYWSGRGTLWRITNCYFDVYDAWHGWSNVACVHRTHAELSRRMESTFESTLSLDVYSKFCGGCEYWPGKKVKCGGRITYLINQYGMSEQAAMADLMKEGKCIEGM